MRFDSRPHIEIERPHDHCGFCFPLRYAVRFLLIVAAVAILMTIWAGAAFATGYLSESRSPATFAQAHQAMQRLVQAGQVPPPCQPDATRGCTAYSRGMP